MSPREATNLGYPRSDASLICSAFRRNETLAFVLSNPTGGAAIATGRGLSTTP